MANGIAVLQAALSGKRVRTVSPTDGPGPWMDASWIKAHARWPIASLWEETWEIEEPTVTWEVAQAEMQAGHTVERRISPQAQYGATLLRQVRQEGHEYKERVEQFGQWSKWDYAHLSYEDLHATDWRVVREEPKDERPTVFEAVAHLMSRPVLEDGEGKAGLRLTTFDANQIAQTLAKWKPAMFREDGQ